MSCTDLELLRRYANARDAEAFAELVARHRDMVYGASYRILASRADAEDSTQECFLSLARDAQSVRSSVAGWLHRVAVRTSIAVRQRDRTRLRTEREAASMMTDGTAEPSWGDIKPDVDRAIDTLPEELRVPLVLHFLEGKPQRAIAEELGLSQPAVSMRIRKGIEGLRRHLQKTGLAVSAAGLAGLLTTHAVEAAPATLVAELGKIALAGVGSASAQVAGGGSALGLGLATAAKAKIVCVVVASLAAAAVIHHTARRPAVSGQATTGHEAVPAPRAPASPPAEPALATATAEPEASPAAPRATVEPHAPRPRGRPMPDPPNATLVARAPERSDSGESTPVGKDSADDVTDPAAVVRAYTDACARGDLDAALALTDIDVDMHDALATMVAQMTQWRTESHDVRTVVSEMAFLPLGLPLSYTVSSSSSDGDTVRVAVTPTTIEDLTFVLRKHDDETWRIALEQSILAATQRDESFVFSRARQESERVAPVPGDTIDWRVRERLYLLTRHLVDYARETGRFPRAESWMDDLEAHYLDRALLYVGDVLSEEYGLALNSKIADTPYPYNREESRRWMVALYVSTDTSRNASGDPDMELESMSADRAGLGACLASEDVVTIPRGMSVDEALLSLEGGEVARQRLAVLVRALLQYARDHDGQLPPAESWSDEVSLYVPPEKATGDLLWSPATPGLESAWAMNSDLAGRDIRDIRHHDQIVLLLPAKAGIANEFRPVPDKVARGLHIIPWADGARLAVAVGLLDGQTRMVLEGDAYPRLSEAGL